jgi:hypothetical protein
MVMLTPGRRIHSRGIQVLPCDPTAIPVSHVHGFVGVFQGLLPLLASFMALDDRRRHVPLEEAGHYLLVRQ